MEKIKIEVPNPYFERCMKDPNHPYHNKDCDKNCPDWPLCSRGEFIEIDLTEEIMQKVEAIFRTYNSREAIEDALHRIGFERWANIDNNPDEELWAYDKGTPNGQILVLINWVHGFTWIYQKAKSIDLL